MTSSNLLIIYILYTKGDKSYFIHKERQIIFYTQRKTNHILYRKGVKSNNNILLK